MRRRKQQNLKKKLFLEDFTSIFMSLERKQVRRC